MKALPEKLQSLRNDLAKVEAMLAREQQGLADTEKFRRDMELQLKTDESSVVKAKSKLGAVKTGKDYMAAQREVENTRKNAGEREDDLLKLVEAIESKKKGIESMEKDVADLRGVVAREEESTDKKVAELQSKLSGDRGERDEIAAKVNPNVLKKYSTIKIRRGLAVVPVVRGTCKGCHMAIPPQLYNNLQKGNTIETCPTCARIIYWDEMMKDKQLERSENETSSET
jgi:predicted  nucleic acid-binding Zn-ribbon protein